ncbi:MAG: hypothetical protein MUE71_09710 [Chitinophagaceae bacterium]|jgi:choline-glycine betaine transporter|nr:hypothetical protein [Chitinophagaceae bacterium]
MNGEIFIPITLFVSAALMIMVIAYYRSRENLAMIERGMNPKLNEAKPTPYRAFRWGMLLIGAGSGLLIAYLIDQTTSLSDTEGIFFALISIGAGVGLIISHKAEKAYLDKLPNDSNNQ